MTFALIYCNHTKHDSNKLDHEYNVKVRLSFIPNK